MAEVQVLGLFADLASAGDAVAAIRAFGVPDSRVTVLSGTPLRAESLGRRRAATPVGRIALAGAIAGAVAGAALLAASYLLYPLDQGAQPTAPVPPSLIVIFETTMLGTMLATFLGMLVAARIPNPRRGPYDPLIAEGRMGLLAEVDEAVAGGVERLMVESGATSVSRAALVPTTQPAFPRLLVAVGAVAALAAAVLGLLAYDVLRVPIRDQMVDQVSPGYEQGPRLAAPADAVPVQGPVLIAGEPASLPVPGRADSLQRGGVMFDIDCAPCHGEAGGGNGPLAEFFSPAPADLASDRVRDLPDPDIFLIITNGRSEMPSLAENLDVDQRWDVINHVRRLAR